MDRGLSGDRAHRQSAGAARECWERRAHFGGTHAGGFGHGTPVERLGAVGGHHISDFGRAPPDSLNTHAAVGAQETIGKKKEPRLVRVTLTPLKMRSCDDGLGAPLYIVPWMTTAPACVGETRWLL